MNLVYAENITKRFVGHTALDNVTVAVQDNTIFGLLGPNGAGKTTLIRIINMITAPDEGKVFFNERPIHPNDIRFIGYLPEERGLYKKMKVGEQSLYLAQLKGLSRHDALKTLKYWFEKFEMTGWWNKKVEELSKGMQQKVQFIITILHKPRLLIFDEPFSGFDPINVSLLKQEILQLKADGSTIIFSTHNMESVEELCDNIALINKSKKILDGNVREIKKNYHSNTYEVEFTNGEDLETKLPKDFKLVEESIHNGLKTAKIEVKDHHRPNDLLKILIPLADIHGFRELLPTMNDIFIATVKAAE